MENANPSDDGPLVIVRFATALDDIPIEIVDVPNHNAGTLWAESWAHDHPEQTLCVELHRPTCPEVAEIRQLLAVFDQQVDWPETSDD